MGLFDRSPEKKLTRARGHQAAGRLFEALKAYEDIIGSKAASAERMSAESGARECRLAMIRLRLDEAEALCQAGDLESARDRCQTAMDVAGEDLDTSDIEEQIRRIDAPRLPVARAGSSRHPNDLLPEPDEVVVQEPTFIERKSGEDSPGPDDDFLAHDDEPDGREGFTEENGGESDDLFEIHLNTMTDQTAGYYRSLGPDFRLAFLALTKGEGRRALESLDRLDPAVRDDPRVQLERAQAMLLAGDAEAGVELLERLDPGRSSDVAGAESGVEMEQPPNVDLPDEADGSGAANEGRRRVLLVDAYRALHRHEDAVREARSLADGTGGQWPAAEALLAWALLEAGRPQEAYDRLQPSLARWPGQDETLIPAAHAAVSLDRKEEAISLLEELIRTRVQRSLAHGEELDFPVEAGRRLLHLYVETDHDPIETRGLVLRLLDYDRERGERYRELLMRLDRAR